LLSILKLPQMTL